LRPWTTDKWKATIDKIKALEANVIGLVETSVNWNMNTLKNQTMVYLVNPFQETT
jgi:hypothetical protein